MEVSFLHTSSGLGHTLMVNLLNCNICAIIKNSLRWSKAALLHTKYFEIPVGVGGECGGEGVTFAFYHHLYLSQWPYSMTIQWNAQISINSINFEKYVDPWKMYRPTPQNIKHVYQLQKVTKEPFQSIPRPQSQPLFWFLTPYINSTNLWISYKWNHTIFSLW